MKLLKSKPDGKLLLLEHIRPHNSFMGLLFDAMNPIALRIMGANINRRTIDNIQKVGWKITKDVNLGNNIVHLIEATP